MSEDIIHGITNHICQEETGSVKTIRKADGLLGHNGVLVVGEISHELNINASGYLCICCECKKTFSHESKRAIACELCIVTKERDALRVELEKVKPLLKRAVNHLSTVDLDGWDHVDVDDIESIIEKGRKS
jgi:hypothetical protein